MRRETFREVQEKVAGLDSELTFGLSFVAAMIDRGDFRAAAGAIEEQRGALAEAGRDLQGVLVGPSRVRRVSVGAAIAAAALVGSGLLVAAVRHGEAAPPEVARLERVADQLETAVRDGSDAARLASIVGGVHRTILSLPQGAEFLVRIRRSLVEIRGRLLEIAPGPVADAARRVAREIEEVVEPQSPQPSPPPAGAPSASGP
ncbi:MAG: hypothetical protein HY775_05725 [Acidobacteria bacterium]|nr:hypothetical protein [Acidobacteriota bacterium]